MSHPIAYSFSMPISPPPRKAGSETVNHKRLKSLSLDWLRRHGCQVVGTEIRAPLSRYRIDVGGYKSARRLGSFGETYLIECKQSRADFLRDVGVENESRIERDETRNNLIRLRTLLAVHLPDCRIRRSLFREYDEYDFSDLKHDRWRRLVVHLNQLERRLTDGVKFSKITRYGIANYCYIAVEKDVIRKASEVPVAWGCLMRSGESLELLEEPTKLVSRDDTKLTFLERLAARCSCSCQPLAKCATNATAPIVKQ